MKNLSTSTKNIAKLGVLAAISVVLVGIIHFPILPAASFLEYDPADIPILLGTFAMGPMAGLLLTVIASVIQGLTVSATSSWYGIIMHIISTGVYVIVAGNIYRHKKTKKTAILALIFGTLSWVIVMIPANLFITPYYYQMIGVPMSREAVAGLLLPAIIPFNLIKAGLNSIITFLVYKRISPLLHK